MNYFEQCLTVEEAIALYWQLLIQHHPDHAGSRGGSITAEIVFDFNDFLNEFSPPTFKQILQKLKNFDCKLEIIGNWIYCFDADEIGETLKNLGCWFSWKHNAWVFSGSLKDFKPGNKTLNQIRARMGCQKIAKEKKAV